MLIDPWTKHLKDQVRKKAIKAWRKKRAVNKKPDKPKQLKKVKKVKVKNKFYSSWEWKKLRVAVMRERGARCEFCGMTPSDTFQGYLVVDHIKPVKQFPHLKLEKTNLQILCNDCNMGKADECDDWRPETARPAPLEQIKEWLDK